MVRDRLPELRMGLNRKGDCCDSVEIYADNGMLQVSQQVDKVLSEFRDIHVDLETIRYNTQSMQNIGSTPIITPQLADLLEEKRQRNLSLSNKVYAKMKMIEPKLPTDDDCSAVARIWRLQFHHYREEFVCAWAEHDAFLANYSARMKKLLARQAKIIDSNFEEEELELLIENQTTSLFVGNIIQHTENERMVLMDLMKNHDEVLKLEKSIVEVREMFDRIRTLVLLQSDKVKNIEYFAEQSTNWVEKGGVGLERAHVWKYKTLKKKTCLLIWLIVILAVIILLLVIL